VDFLKKNWGKIVIAAVALAGVIVTLIPLVTAPEFKFIGAMQVLGPFLFFVGLLAYVCMKMFGRTKSYEKFVLFGIGLLVTILMCVGIAGFSTKDNGKNAEGVLGSASVSFHYQAEYFKGEKVDLETTLAQLQAAVAGGLMTAEQAAPQIAQLEAGIKQYKGGIDKATYASKTLLYTYIAMILAFGGLPLAIGGKKLVRHFCCKEQADCVKQ